MSKKKNRGRFQNRNIAAQPSPAVAEPRASASGFSRFSSATTIAESDTAVSQPISPAELAAHRLAGASTPDSSDEIGGDARSVAGSVSAARLAANVANAQLSTGPRTAAGLETSSKNAVKTALTGRTVLLPTDDAQEYAALVAEFQQDLKPLGQFECELVQIIVDCHWRLRRIQALEYALYAHGHEQFAGAFQDSPKEEQYSKILLQTHLTYEKQLRNLQIQEARIDRKASKAMAELRRLQAERTTAAEPEGADDFQGFPSEQALFAALDAGFVPPSLAAKLRPTERSAENGFVFSNDAVESDLAVTAPVQQEAA